eukprot:Polyplicarium_translucidae@DN2745_c0_g1_i3.p1
MSQTSDVQVLLGLMAGFWLSLWGHVAARTGQSPHPKPCGDGPAGNFYYPEEKWSAGLCALVYGGIFPGGIMSIVFTSTELYTGNTAYMWMHVLEKRGSLRCVTTRGSATPGRSWRALLKVWTISVVTNVLGGLAVAFFMGYLTGSFSSGPPRAFLISMAEKKVSYGWAVCFLYGEYRALLASLDRDCGEHDCLRCLVDGGAIELLGRASLHHLVHHRRLLLGRLRARRREFLLYPSGNDVRRRYHDRCANSVMCMLYDIGRPGQMVSKNWVPTFLGNTVAGALLHGTVWWWTMRSRESDDDDTKESRLPRGQFAPPDRGAAVRRRGPESGSRRSIGECNSVFLDFAFFGGRVAPVDGCGASSAAVYHLPISSHVLCVD